MTDEKKGFWAKLKGSKKSSGCCSMKIEEIPDEAPAAPAVEEKEKQADPGPCCGEGSTPRRGGGCCG